LVEFTGGLGRRDGIGAMGDGGLVLDGDVNVEIKDVIRLLGSPFG
jgi:hypothetical protein